MNSNCSNLLGVRNLQEQVKICSDLSLFEYINCTSDLKNFANSWPSASNFQIFSQTLKQFFLTVGQNNFGNKIQFLTVFRNTYQWVGVRCTRFEIPKLVTAHILSVQEKKS